MIAAEAANDSARVLYGFFAPRLRDIPYGCYATQGPTSLWYVVGPYYALFASNLPYVGGGI